ncbi:MAG: oligosaccharide flippase family protein [Oscillospiraceae bacterium]|nr:oligosaccharide flippase family protein [Oscillospiraceae bacterium]
MMKAPSVVAGTVLLSASSIFVRMMGFLFRIYLSNKIGAEGMGLYTLIMSLYALGATVSLSGVSMAVSKLAAEELACGRRENARHILKRALYLSLFFSLFVCAVMLLFARPISLYILKDPRCEVPLMLLAPGMPLLSLSACFRGYFIASRHVGNPAAAQVLEQVFKMGFIILLLAYWLPKGIAHACAAVVLGITFGELICFIYTVSGYLIEKKRPFPNQEVTIRGATAKILRIIIPVSISSSTRSALRLLEDVLILSGFRRYIGAGSGATEVYGLLKGMVMPLLIFPLSLLSAFVVTLTPEISRLGASNDSARLERVISRILQITCIVGIFIVVIFMSFSFEIGVIAYNDESAGRMLKQMAFLCPFMCVEMVVVSILYGLGEQSACMRYSIADCLLRIAMVAVLIPSNGVNGFIWMIVASNLFTSALHLNKLLDITKINLKINDWIVKPVIAALCAGQAVRAAYNFYLFDSLSLWQGLILGLIILTAVYVLALFSTGCISRGDFAWIKPFSRLPVKIQKNSLEIAY